MLWCLLLENTRKLLAKTGVREDCTSSRKGGHHPGEKGLGEGGGRGGGRREITLAAGARLWQGDSRRRFRTDRRTVSVGQPDAR